MVYGAAAVFFLVSFEAGRRRSPVAVAIWVIGCSWLPAVIYRMVTTPTPDQTLYLVSIAQTVLGAAVAGVGFGLSITFARVR